MAETCRKYSAVPIVRVPKRVCPRLLLRFPPEAEARWCNQQVPRLKTVFRVVAACATFYQLVNGAWLVRGREFGSSAAFASVIVSMVFMAVVSLAYIKAAYSTLQHSLLEAIAAGGVVLLLVVANVSGAAYTTEEVVRFASDPDRGMLQEVGGNLRFQVYALIIVGYHSVCFVRARRSWLVTVTAFLSWPSPLSSKTAGPASSTSSAST